MKTISLIRATSNVESGNNLATIPAFKRQSRHFTPIKRELLVRIFRQFVSFTLLIPAIGVLEFLCEPKCGWLLQAAFPLMLIQLLTISDDARDYLSGRLHHLLREFKHSGIFPIFLL